MEDLPTRFVEAAHAAMDADGIPQDCIVSLDDREGAGFQTGHPAVHLDYFEVPIPLRRMGWGSRVLRLLTTLADQMGVALTLTTPLLYDPHRDEVNGSKAMSEAELAGWYGRHGFRGVGSMIRLPGRD